jgi:hypothetical protein
LSTDYKTIYANPTNKNNIYNNLSQDIPKYTFLRNNSSLDSNDFKYLLVLKHFSFQPKIPEIWVENNIFKELDIKRVILYLDL